MQDHRKKTGLEARAEKKDIDVNVLLYAKTPRADARAKKEAYSSSAINTKMESSRGCRGKKGARARKFGIVP